MNLCVFGSACNDKDGIMVAVTENLGREMAKRGHTLIFGGGKSGMMGAVAKGMYKENGRIIGIAPYFFNDGDHYFKNCTEFINTETMRERKQLMEDKSDAFIVTPGGIGTFDEFFETFTLLSLGRHKKHIAVLNAGGYYDYLEKMLSNAVETGFMTMDTKNLIGFFKDPKELLNYLENEIKEN